VETILSKSETDIHFLTVFVSTFSKYFSFYFEYFYLTIGAKLGKVSHWPTFDAIGTC
jgi:hypothetical protein